MKNIIFLLPASGRRPVGGYKVIYEYANRLVAHGYQVSIVYPAYCFRFGQSSMKALLRQCMALLRFSILEITKGYSCRNWFNLDNRVKEHWVWSLSCKLPSDAICFATAIQTAVYLNQHKEILEKNKFYLIQHFENWGGATSDDVIASYRYLMQKIVISHWLEKILQDVGENAVLIPNGFDFEYFRNVVDIASRQPTSVCMLYHSSDWKGCADGFRALDIVRKKYPNVIVNIFGVSPRPKELPDWYHYYQSPDKETHNRIYNESAIFIGTSWTEGWGLTVGEAMICGCAVACTDNLGYLEMATDNVTALVSPIKNPEALAANIIRLIEDNQLRYRIAKAGNENIRQFTWERAYGKLKKVLFKL